MKICLTTLTLASLALACSSSTGSGPTSAGGTGGKYSLTMQVTLTPDADGNLAFITPSNATVSHPVADLVGKPYLVATFAGGFSPGNASPIDSTWGTVPSDLSMTFTTPPHYANGPYDTIWVIYEHTPISASVQAGSVVNAPTPSGGDVAAFSLDESVVLAGDPKNAVGTIRMNVQSADAQVSLTNKWETDAASSFDNTMLSTP